MTENSENLIIFNEGVKVIKISIDVLKRTIPLKGPGGRMPNNRPKQHYQVFNQILKMCEKIDLEARVDHIYIHRNHTDQVDEEYAAAHNIDSINHPEGNHVKMCVGKILIGGKFENKEDETAIGISYSTAGIDICVGQNVKTCQNMTVFGGRFLRNHGKDKISYEAMIAELEEWLNELPEIMEYNHAVIDAMKNLKLDHSGVRGLYGALIESAILANYFNGTKSPLNDSQVTEFIKRAIPAVKKSGNDINLYELYNIGTNILTHQAALNNRWESVKIFGEFLILNYNI